MRGFKIIYIIVKLKIMARLKDGLIGGVSGKIGNVIISSRYGKEYVKSAPDKVMNPKTKEQVKQRSKFSVTMAFLKTITPFVRVGFQSASENRRTPTNAASSYIMKNAFTNDAGNLGLDYSKVLVSMGDLDTSEIINIEFNGRELTVYWDANFMVTAKDNDQVMLLVHNSNLGESVFDIGAGKRSHGSAKIVLPNDWKNQDNHIYLAFRSADGKKVSDSVYHKKRPSLNLR